MAFLDISNFQGITPSNVSINSKCKIIPSSNNVDIAGIKGALCQEDIYAIVNVTRGEVIYNPFDSGKFGVLYGNTMSLDFDISTMSEDDYIYTYLLDTLKYKSELSVSSILSDIKSKIDKQSNILNNLLT